MSSAQYMTKDETIKKVWVILYRVEAAVVRDNFFGYFCASQVLCQTTLLYELCHSQQGGQELISGSLEGPNTPTVI